MSLCMRNVSEILFFTVYTYCKLKGNKLWINRMGTRTIQWAPTKRKPSTQNQKCYDLLVFGRDVFQDLGNAQLLCLTNTWCKTWQTQGLNEINKRCKTWQFQLDKHKVYRQLDKHYTYNLTNTRCTCNLTNTNRTLIFSRHGHERWWETKAKKNHATPEAEPQYLLVAGKVIK